MPVCPYADAAPQMTHNQIDILIGSAQLRGRLSADGFMVQGVELAYAAEPGKAGIVRHLRHLVHTDGIHKKSRDSRHCAQFSGQIGTQIGWMLAIWRRFHVMHHPFIHGVCTRWNGTIQAAPTAHRVKIPHIIAGSSNSVENRRLSILRLIDHMGESIQLFRRMIDAHLEELLLLLKDGHLCAGGSGIDNQYFHGGSSLFSHDVSN